MIGMYRGYAWKLQRICDVLYAEATDKWYFLYDKGEATGHYFRTLAELKQYVDNLPAVCD